MINSKKILIFGGSGSLGKTLIKKFKDFNDVFIFSRDEAKHWTIKNEISNLNRVKFIIGDIRDKEKVSQTIFSTNPDIIIVAAALKQVDICELDPKESILTNIAGTQNVLDAAENFEITTNKISTVLFVSTDKACSPINVYGMCKSISERLVTSFSMKKHLRSKFACVRYGNVLESRGSIIPLFKYQAKNSDFFTVTDPAMTRFVMTLDQSVDLIIDAIENSQSGEIFVPKLKSMKIGDLAEIFSNFYKKDIKIIGLRPGEKINESLINCEESSRSSFSGERYIINHSMSESSEKYFEYTSNQDILSKKDLENYLISLNIFEMELSSFVGKTIEEIKKLSSEN